MTGQIVEETTGRSVEGARLEMRSQIGVALSTETASAVTDDDGVFALELPASNVGDAIVTISVATPGRPSYVVPDVRARATVVTGEATVLPPWVDAHPAFPYVLVFFHDPLKEDPAPGATIEFTRTGGVNLFSADSPVLRVQGTTNEVGWLYLFSGITADRAGDVIGDLVIQVPPTGRSVVLKGVTFPAVVRFRQPTTIVVIGVGSP